MNFSSVIAAESKTTTPSQIQESVWGMTGYWEKSEDSLVLFLPVHHGRRMDLDLGAGGVISDSIQHHY